MVIIQRVRSVSVNVRQMLYLISRPNNNEQNYFLFGSVHYFNPIRCDWGFTFTIFSEGDTIILHVPVAAPPVRLFLYYYAILLLPVCSKKCTCIIHNRSPNNRNTLRKGYSWNPCYGSLVLTCPVAICVYRLYKTFIVVLNVIRYGTHCNL